MNKLNTQIGKLQTGINVGIGWIKFEAKGLIKANSFYTGILLDYNSQWYFSSGEYPTDEYYSIGIPIEYQYYNKPFILKVGSAISRIIYLDQLSANSKIITRYGYAVPVFFGWGLKGDRIGLEWNYGYEYNTFDPYRFLGLNLSFYY